MEREGEKVRKMEEKWVNKSYLLSNARYPSIALNSPHVDVRRTDAGIRDGWADTEEGQ